MFFLKLRRICEFFFEVKAKYSRQPSIISMRYIIQEILDHEKIFYFLHSRKDQYLFISRKIRELFFMIQLYIVVFYLKILHADERVILTCEKKLQKRSYRRRYDRSKSPS